MATISLDCHCAGDGIAILKSGYIAPQLSMTTLRLEPEEPE